MVGENSIVAIELGTDVEQDSTPLIASKCDSILLAHASDNRLIFNM